jgi:hypothetical protein
MTYQKPEVAVLGDAAHLVQGSKHNSVDDGSLTSNGVTDCELDD